jgi:putative SOS response-associated peptidase YedK
MCGRYTLSATPARINTQFSVSTDPAWQPNYNVAPGTGVLIVRALPEGPERIAETAYWGFTPPWFKAGGKAPRPINARTESIASKPMFRHAFARRRCILPADGFYEWKKLDNGKQPWLIRQRDGEVFGFAGIYEPATEFTGDRPSCAILTTEANQLMCAIHARMPLILRPGDYSRWLDPGSSKTTELEELLRPCDPDFLVAVPVSTRVNNVRNNDEGLLRPANAA